MDLECITLYGKGAVLGHWTYKCVRILVVLLLAALAGFPSKGFAGAIVGTAKTVVRTVEGISDAEVRTLIINDNVHQSEKIRTKDLSVTRIQFSDKTDFLVGPNSEVILDKFIYDPDAAKDNLSLRISWGLMKWRPPESLISAF